MRTILSLFVLQVRKPRSRVVAWFTWDPSVNVTLSRAENPGHAAHYPTHNAPALVSFSWPLILVFSEPPDEIIF